MELRDAVRDLRKGLKLSQQKLADRLGVALTTVQRWEQGETQPLPAALYGLYKVSQELDRPDLHMAFVTVQPILVDATIGSLVFELAHVVRGYFAAASTKLVQVIADPTLAENDRRVLVAEALGILVEGQQSIDRFTRRLDEQGTAGGAGNP